MIWRTSLVSFCFFYCSCVGQEFVTSQSNDVLTSNGSGNTTTTDPTSSPSPSSTTMSPEDLFLRLKITHVSTECREKMLKADSCVSDALFVGRDPEKILIPSTEKDLDFYCASAKTTYDCIIDYKKCLKLFPKTFFGIIARDVKKTMKRLCGTAKGRSDILRHLKCFDPKNIPLLYRLMNGWTKVLNYIADDINPDVIIPNLCCSYHYMLFEGMARVREECTNRTGPETGKFIMSVIESVVSSAVDLGCGKHNSFQVCQELMWPEMQFFFNLTLVGMDEPFLVSPIIPLLKIAENLDASLST